MNRKTASGAVKPGDFWVVFGAIAEVGVTTEELPEGVADPYRTSSPGVIVTRVWTGV